MLCGTRLSSCMSFKGAAARDAVAPAVQSVFNAGTLCGAIQASSQEHRDLEAFDHVNIFRCSRHLRSRRLHLSHRPARDEMLRWFLCLTSWHGRPAMYASELNKIILKDVFKAIPKTSQLKSWLYYTIYHVPSEWHQSENNGGTVFECLNDIQHIFSKGLCKGTYLSIYLSIYLPIYLSIHLSIYLY